MAQDTSEKIEPATQTNLALPEPDMILPDDHNYFPTHVHANIAKLTSNQRKILLALAENLVAEDIRTDKEIAADLGLQRRAIYEARQKPEFSIALTELCRDLVRGTADIALKNLMQLSVKDTKATEIWLRIAEIYQPTQRNVNVNASLGRIGEGGESISVSIEKLLTRLGQLGWGEDRVKELSDAMPAMFAELRSQGAF